MRRYELMLVLRPDVPDDKSQALVDRTTRGIVAAGGQIVKVAPWGRRRLAYPIDRHREGSYHIILFEAPSEAIVELEHTLLITEEVLRHLVTRVDRPSKTARPDGDELDGL
jgi:small subunit ribosomal protein S6